MKVAPQTQPNLLQPAPQKSSAERYQPIKDTLELGAFLTGGGAAGLLAGSAVGFFAHSQARGSYAYTYLAPAAGMALGALTGGGAYAENNPAVSRLWGSSASTVGLASIGAVAGDLIGHGLTNLTQNPVYSAIGAIAGSVNGGLLGIHLESNPTSAVGKSTKYLMPGALGLSIGASTGVCAGALVSHVTGSNAYNAIAPAIGALAGVVTGLAIAVNQKPSPQD